MPTGISSTVKNEIVFLGHPGTAQQTVSRIRVGTQLDDTIWTQSGPGRLFITDGKNNTVYTLHTNVPAGTIFTAVPGDSAVAGFIGTVSIATGNVTPITVGFGSPTCLIFVPDHQTGSGSQGVGTSGSGAQGGSVPLLPQTGSGSDFSWLLLVALFALAIGFATRRANVRITPTEEAISCTLEWFRQRPGIVMH